MQLRDKHMDLLTKDSFKQLLNPPGAPCVSIFIGTTRGSDADKGQKNATRFKNQLREAENQLAAQDVAKKEIETLLAPARDVLDDNFFWEYQSDGLAFFLSEGKGFPFRLPLKFEDMAVVSNQFQIKPLIPAITGDGHFYILALSQNNTRLFHGTRSTVQQIDLDDTPTSLEEAVSEKVFETSVQFHTGTGGGGARSAMFHGQGAAADDSNVKENILEFFKELDNGIRDLLGDKQAPLILAGVDHIQAIYHEANHYHYLLDDGIKGNPDQMTASELHVLAWRQIEPLFQKDKQKAIDRYQHLAGSDDKRASNDVATIVAGAQFERVDTLFVSVTHSIWGTVDGTSEQVDIHDVRQPGDDDLLNLATIHTLQNGGQVYTLISDEMPVDSSAAAIMRF